MHSKGIQGYGLIDILIVMTLIGILTTVVYPTYQQHHIKANRLKMMSELQRLAVQLQHHKLVQGDYRKVHMALLLQSAGTHAPDHKNSTASKALLVKFPYTHQQPNSGNRQNSQALYIISLTPLDNEGYLTSAHWQLIATPTAAGKMASDGVLSLNYLGQQCHQQSCSRVQAIP